MSKLNYLYGFKRRCWSLLQEKLKFLLGKIKINTNIYLFIRQIWKLLIFGWLPEDDDVRQFTLQTVPCIDTGINDACKNYVSWWDVVNKINYLT